VSRLRRTIGPELALFGHAAISKLSLLSGVERKLDLDPAKGNFWREAAVRAIGGYEMAFASEGTRRKAQVQ